MKKRLIASALALALLLIGTFTQRGDAAASLTASVELVVTGTLTNTLDLATVSSPLVIRRALALANGVGANQANVIWSDNRTLAPSASENLDLNGGGLVDAFGTAIAPARLRTVVIYAAAANTNNLTLFGNANSVPLLNTAATTVTLQPGGVYVYTAPATAGTVVTAGTGDIIQVANAGAGTSVTYDIVVIGASS